MRFLLMVDGGWQGDECETLPEALRIMASYMEEEGRNSQSVTIVDTMEGGFDVDLVYSETSYASFVRCYTNVTPA